MTRTRKQLEALIVGLAISLNAIACAGTPTAPDLSRERPPVPAPTPTTASQTVYPNVTIAGIVFEVTGAGRVPVKDAYVEACGFALAITGADGRFTMSVPSNTPSVFVHAKDFRAESFSLNTEMEARLHRE